VQLKSHCLAAARVGGHCTEATTYLYWSCFVCGPARHEALRWRCDGMDKKQLSSTATFG